MPSIKNVVTVVGQVLNPVTIPFEPAGFSNILICRGLKMMQMNQGFMQSCLMVNKY